MVLVITFVSIKNKTLKGDTLREVEGKIHNEVKMKDFATKKDIDSLETRLSAKIDRLETKIDNLEIKIDNLETKLSAKIDKKIAEMTLIFTIVTITTYALMTAFLSIFLSISK